MKRIVFVGVLFFCLIVPIPYIVAQTVSADKNESLVAAQFIAPAVLVRGPVESRGFPLIYPNALEFWSGDYRYLGKKVIISFTRKDILLPNEWESLRCNRIEGFSPSKESFYYRAEDWAVLFRFPPDVVADCVFINTFIIRLKYFLRDSSPEDPPLLPAILEFP